MRDVRYTVLRQTVRHQRGLVIPQCSEYRQNTSLNVCLVLYDGLHALLAGGGYEIPTGTSSMGQLENKTPPCNP